MTTTIKPAHLFDRKTSVLRTPVVIKGSIDRSNVEIHILPYCVGRIKIEDTEKDEKWEPVGETGAIWDRGWMGHRSFQHVPVTFFL